MEIGLLSQARKEGQVFFVSLPLLCAKIGFLRGKSGSKGYCVRCELDNP
jgi:hypothetical protein